MADDRDRPLLYSLSVTTIVLSPFKTLGWTPIHGRRYATLVAVTTVASCRSYHEIVSGRVRQRGYDSAVFVDSHRRQLATTLVTGWLDEGLVGIIELQRQSFHLELEPEGSPK